MSKKVFVTGGCGYIGSHVARAFKHHDPNHQVHIIDRVKRDHTLKGMDGFIIDDFASDACLSSILSLEPDVIVHCAGTSLVGPSMTNPAEYYENNIAKTIRMMNVIQGMRKKPYILFSSSASVYGEPSSLPISEDSDIRPISPYGATKAMSERIFRDYSVYGINSVCFRYFNAAGAEPVSSDLGQEPGATHIVGRALESSLSGTAFTINGNDFPTPDGTCVRDYVHVWDIAIAHVQGIEFLDRESSSSLGPHSYIFNLGTNVGVSNKEIAEYVQDRYGLVEINYGLRRSGDPAELVADADFANEILGWTPKHSDIKTIIDSAYKWYSKS